MHGVIESVGTMSERPLQITFDGPDADLKSLSDLLRSLPFDCNAAKHFAGPRRQFRQRALERFDFRSRLRHPGRIRSVVADVQKRIELCGANPVILSLLAILRDIDGGAKNIVRRAAHGFNICYPVQTQEGLMQGLVGEI